MTLWGKEVLLENKKGLILQSMVS